MQLACLVGGQCSPTFFLSLLCLWTFGKHSYAHFLARAMGQQRDAPHHLVCLCESDCAVEVT